MKFTIYGIHENYTECSVDHDNSWAFNFTCKFVPTLSNVSCYNETLEFKYHPFWNEISIVNITCYKFYYDTKIMYEDGISLDVEPSNVNFSHADIFSNSIGLHFNALNKIVNLTGVWIDELNVSRHLLGDSHKILTTPISIINQSSLYDFENPFIDIEYTCQVNKIYRISFEVRNGVFLETYSEDIVVPDLVAKTLKKYYAVTNPYLVDVYYPYDLLIETANVLNVNFTYHWAYMENEYVTEVNTIHIPLMPLIGKCYTAYLTLNSVQVLTVNVNRTICVDIGINGTIEFDFANSLGEASIFEVLMNRFGNSSCIAIDFAGTFFVNSMELCDMHSQISGATVMTFVNNASTVSHVMANKGDFPLRFIAKNNVHDQMETFVVSIINLTCHVPVIQIIGMFYNFSLRQ